MYTIIMHNILKDAINGLSDDRRYALWHIVAKYEARGCLSAEQADECRQMVWLMTRVYNPRH